MSAGVSSGVSSGAGARAAVVGVRLAYGVLLLAVPDAALPAEAGDRVEGVVARLLGARHLVQGLAAAWAPRLVTSGRSALVDGSHGASMLAWAVLDRRHRRAALVNAATAGLFVAAEVPHLRRRGART